MIRVANKPVVTIRYIMRNSRGEVLENTLSGPSASYLHGGSGILESFRSSWRVYTAGERKQVLLLERYESLEDDFTFDVLIEKIREALPQEIVLGYPVTGTAMECGPGCACFY